MAIARGDMHNRVVGMALVNVATFVWATNMVLGRALREVIGPVTLSAGRFVVASLVFWVFLRHRPPEERQLGKDWKYLVGMALMGGVLFMPTLYLGVRYTTAVNATLINAMGPLLTGVWAALLIREPMTPRQVVAAIVALVGVAWLIAGGEPRFWEALQVNIGDLITLIAVAMWGIYSVFSRVVTRERSVLSATALSGFLALPWLMVGAVGETLFLPVQWRPYLIPAVVYIGLFPTVVGFLAWNEGVRRLGPSGAMVFYNMLPVYGALLGTLLLQEPFGWAHAIGGGLIIGAGVWAGLGQPAVRGARSAPNHLLVGRTPPVKRG